MIRKFKVLIFLISLFFSGSLFGQTKTNSPYSRLGVGDMVPEGTIRNIGMGGTGISNPHPEFINIINPALLPVNRLRNLDSTLKNTMFDAGLTAHFNQLKTNANTEGSSGLNMAYFIFAFPLSSRWTTSAGLRPLTNVHSKFTTDEIVTNDPNTVVRKFYNTSGGINKVFVSNGYDLSQTLSIGLDMSYLFGGIKTQGLSQLQPFDFTSKYGYENLVSYSGFQIKPGLAYRKEVKKGQGVFLNTGFTYDFFAATQARKVRDLVSYNGDDFPLNTTRVKDSVIDVTLPKTLGIGLSLDKPESWAIAADFSYSKWSAYRDFESSTSLFSNSYSISVGGEFKLGKKDHPKRKDFRTGFSYAKSPLTFNGNQLNDFSFSIGFTIPVSSKKASPNPVLPKLNLALVVGQRGTTSNNLLLEQYMKVYLGVTVNDKWFRKRKIE